MAVPYHQLFNFLRYSPVFVQAAQSSDTRIMQALLDTLSGYDDRTDVCPTLGGTKVAAESDMAIRCFLRTIEGSDEPEVQDLVNTIRGQGRGPDTPTYLISELNGIEALAFRSLSLAQSDVASRARPILASTSSGMVRAGTGVELNLSHVMPMAKAGPSEAGKPTCMEARKPESVWPDHSLGMYLRLRFESHLIEGE